MIGDSGKAERWIREDFEPGVPASGSVGADTIRKRHAGLRDRSRETS